MPLNKTPAVVGVRTATGSVGFNLETLNGVPSFPQGEKYFCS